MKKKNWFRKLTNNWSLKLFSLMAAFLLWLVVMTIENPEDRKTFYNIPVKLVNTEVLTDADMVYEIMDKTDVVRSVTIVAKKTIRDELSSSDIVAEADFSNLTVANTVEIRFYSLRYNEEITSISGSTEILKLNIEDKKTKRLTLTIETTGEVEGGYFINSVTADQNRIEVSGPESVVSKVASARVRVDVTDSNSNISEYSDVILYDAEGKEIAKDNISLSVSSVLVKVEILDTKTVPLHYEVIGTPAEGYLFTGEIDSTPHMVVIGGSTEALAGVSTIIIPAEALNITGQTEDMKVNIDVRDYLPEGVVLADTNFNGKAEVTVHIEEEQIRDLTLTPDKIRMLGVPAGYRVELEDTVAERTIRVMGLRAEVDAIDVETFTGQIYVNTLMEERGWETLPVGVYEAEVEFYLPENVHLTAPLRVNISITKLEE